VSFGRAKDPEFLRKAATVLESENRRLLREVVDLKEKVRVLEGAEPSQLALRNEELERQLALRNKKLFGESSEKRLSDRDDEKSARAAQTGHGPREQLGLQDVERVHELDDADRVCPQCGRDLKPWLGQYEEAEEIDMLEQQYLRVQNKRQKYRCACGCIETALAPARLVPGGRYSVAFATHVTVTKYADHGPLERQVKIMARHGLRVDSQTLWDQVHALATALSPAHVRLREYLLQKPVLGADETHWRVMGSDKQRWQVWAICADEGVYYQIEDNRSAEAASSVLGDFAGKLLVDGYGVYSALKKRGGRFEIAHCWAHTRRKFVEVEDLHAGRCTEVLDMIGELYEVERIARAGPEPLLQARARLRAERSVAIVDRIHAWALQQRALPESPLGRAIGYLGAMWQGLLVFLREPEVDIDNNDVERALRGVVLGRKNHLGSRSKRGTEVAAIFYSLVESAKLAGIDPSAYLKAAVAAALRGEIIPLPHEIAAR
jgi:transposase